MKCFTLIGNNITGRVRHQGFLNPILPNIVYLPFTGGLGRFIFDNSRRQCSVVLNTRTSRLQLLHVTDLFGISTFRNNHTLTTKLHKLELTENLSLEDMSSREKKKQNTRGKGNTSAQSSSSSSSSPSEKMPKRNTDESPDSSCLVSSLMTNDVPVPKDISDTSNNADISVSPIQRFEHTPISSGAILDSSSSPRNPSEILPKLFDSTPNSDTQIILDSSSSSSNLSAVSPNLSESMNGLNSQNKEISSKHEEIDTTGLHKQVSDDPMEDRLLNEGRNKEAENIAEDQSVNEKSESKEVAKHLVDCVAEDHVPVNKEQTPIRDVDGLEGSAISDEAIVTIPLEVSKVSEAPSNDHIDKDSNPVTIKTIDSERDPLAFKTEPDTVEKDAIGKLSEGIAGSDLELTEIKDVESDKTCEAIGQAISEDRTPNITKECLYFVGGKGDHKAKDDDVMGQIEKSHDASASLDKEAKSPVKTLSVMSQLNSTPILGSPRVVQNTRAYSNTSSNNDGAKDKPKTRTQIAQNEKDRYLKMPLDEKRKYYSCDEDYVTLEQVETWPVYFTRSAARLVKKLPKGREIRRKLGGTHNPHACDVEIASKVSIWKGDITALEIDCIVNAANSSLLGGGGVDGAIHRAAGSALVQECRLLNGCDTGDAKITGGYKLPAKYVIHTVGPTDCSEHKLTSCYRSCLWEMKGNGHHSIAFCCISTGIYGYPNEAAVHVALGVARKFLDDMKRKNKIADVERIVFCLFLPIDVDLYESWMQWYFPLPPPDPAAVADTDRTIVTTPTGDLEEKEKHKNPGPQSRAMKLTETDVTTTKVDKQQDLDAAVKIDDVENCPKVEQLAKIEPIDDATKEEFNLISSEQAQVKTDNCTPAKCESNLRGFTLLDDRLLKTELAMETETEAAKCHESMEVEAEESMEIDSSRSPTERSPPVLTGNCDLETPKHSSIASNL